jgi:hypothetical protein
VLTMTTLTLKRHIVATSHVEHLTERKKTLSCLISVINTCSRNMAIRLARCPAPTSLQQRQHCTAWAQIQAPYVLCQSAGTNSQASISNRGCHNFSMHGALYMTPEKPINHEATRQSDLLRAAALACHLTEQVRLPPSCLP